MTARRLFWVALGGFTGSLAYLSVAAPDRVPIHVGASGVADRVVDRGQAVLELSLIGYGTAALLAGSAALVHRLPLSLFNVPHRDYWTREEHEEALRSLVARDLWAVNALTMVFFSVLVILVTSAADDSDAKLASGALVLAVAYLAVLSAYLFLAMRSYRPSDAG